MFRRFLATRFASYQARIAVEALLSKALLREGVYLASWTLFDRWPSSTERQLVDTFTKTFSIVLDDRSELTTWKLLRDRLSDPDNSSRLIENPIGPLMLRIASQAPQAVELTEFVLGNFDKPTYTFSADLIGVGQRLITQKRYDAGLAALVGAAHRDLAGRDGVTRVRDNMFRLTPRLARVLEGAIANHLARTLDYFAATLAQSSNYSGAVHVRLLAQLISGDVDRFKQFGRILFGIEGEALFKEPEEPVEISVDLFRKGYRTQAIELLVASTGAIDAESTRWQKMYEALPDNAHLWSILPDRISVIPH